MTHSGKVRQLGASTGHLVNHLQTCDVCLEAGTRWCPDVSELRAIVGADRKLLLDDDSYADH